MSLEAVRVLQTPMPFKSLNKWSTSCENEGHVVIELKFKCRFVFTSQVHHVFSHPPNLAHAAHSAWEVMHPLFAWSTSTGVQDPNQVSPVLPTLPHLGSSQ